jgi:hypothetical protein
VTREQFDAYREQNLKDRDEAKYHAQSKDMPEVLIHFLLALSTDALDQLWTWFDDPNYDRAEDIVHFIEKIHFDTVEFED